MNEQGFIIVSKYFRDDKKILVKVKLKHTTSINPSVNDIFFYVSLDQYYPENAPIVTCNSNVSY
jgi:hypothetical protein